jgi:hypothetical protein
LLQIGTDAEERLNEVLSGGVTQQELDEILLLYDKDFEEVGNS